MAPHAAAAGTRRFLIARLTANMMPAPPRTQGRCRATSETVAVKSISKAKLVCKEDVKDVQAEVAIMNLVGGHPHVVTLRVGAGSWDLRCHVDTSGRGSQGKG
jgi:hypothetical protein